MLIQEIIIIIITDRVSKKWHRSCFHTQTHSLCLKRFSLKTVPLDFWRLFSNKNHFVSSTIKTFLSLFFISIYFDSLRLKKLHCSTFYAFQQWFEFALVSAQKSCLYFSQPSVDRPNKLQIHKKKTVNINFPILILWLVIKK